MLLRGSVLANTEYIFGMVAYTGKDTKIMLNQGRQRVKRSRIEGVTNVIYGV